MEARERDERRYKYAEEARILTSNSLNEDRPEGDTEKITSTG
jgi:hypothetical protein